MSDTQNEEVLETQDEMTALKARADLMGISYHPSIGLEKLRSKVADALADKPAETEATSDSEKLDTTKETLNEKRKRLRDEASALVRIRVTCMNPNKKEWDGEIITAGNAAVGTFKKFVPFHSADDGWHVPNIIYKQLVQRECQIFVTTTDGAGNKIRKGKLIKEFAIEVLPDLTEEELAELARRQAMAKSID